MKDKVLGIANLADVKATIDGDTCILTGNSENLEKAATLLDKAGFFDDSGWVSNKLKDDFPTLGKIRMIAVSEDCYGEGYVVIRESVKVAA
jgi:hypothetical protein